MRILIITGKFWPENAPRANRWSAICEELLAQGVNVDVITSKVPGTKKFESINGLSIYRTIDILAVAGNEVKNQKETGSFQNSSAFSYKNILKKIYDCTIKKVYWPDVKFLWIITSFLKARKIMRKNSYDGIITVAHPFSSHVVGLLVRRWAGNIPWVCDYGDPFCFITETEPNNFKLYNRLNRSVEKRILKNSRKIAVTTKETASEYIKHLEVPEKWFTTIPALFKDFHNSCIANGPNKVGLQRKYIRLLYLGALYKNIRNPLFLLRLLEKLNNLSSFKKIIIDFYGSVSDCYEEFDLFNFAMGDWLFLRGNVKRDKLPAVYSEADVLVNIGNSVPFQLPSKIVEYVATGKPILNIASIEKDSVTGYLSAYPSAITLLEKEGLSNDQITKCLVFFNSAVNVDSETVNNYLLRHSPEIITKQYMKLLLLN